jgi:hypothetical protein
MSGASNSFSARLASPAKEFWHMDTGGNAIPSPALAIGKNPRGRPRRNATESHQQKIERLQDELRRTQEALKIFEERRASIVGAAALRHVRRNTEFARHLAAMLRAEIKVKVDRAAIRDLINDDNGKVA